METGERLKTGRRGGMEGYENQTRMTGEAGRHKYASLIEGGEDRVESLTVAMAATPW